MGAALSGCSGGIHSSLLDMQMRVDSPMLTGGKGAVAAPVMYPYRNIQPGAADLGPSFGPAWMNLQGAYPDYWFNY